MTKKTIKMTKESGMFMNLDKLRGRLVEKRYTQFRINIDMSHNNQGEFDVLIEIYRVI